LKIKSQTDFWSGVMFIAVGLGFSYGALEYNFGTSARPGPGYFPFGLGILLAILGGMTLFEALTVETEDGEPIGAVAWKPLLIIIGSTVLFGVLLPHAGLAIALAAAGDPVGAGRRRVPLGRGDRAGRGADRRAVGRCSSTAWA
jgi:hypothetical protein